MDIKALIVDDESPDREVLKSLIKTYCRYLTVVGEANTIESALERIGKHMPDIVFLDIELHGNTGFQLLEALPDRKFLTVMTTGFDQYGIRALKLGAFDYLLKPIDVDELLDTERKLATKLDEIGLRRTIRVQHQGENLLIKPNEIIYLEAQGSYTRVHLADKTDILIAKNLTATLEEFSMSRLQRIHRSFAVHQDHVRSVQLLGNEGRLVLSNHHVLPVSRKYKTMLKK
jgi:two-component system LytT family response regulator